jgi:hypothetical protein
MDVCLLYSVCVVRGLCDGPIHRPEESYRPWCVFKCDQEKIKTFYTCCEQVGRRAKDYVTMLDECLTVNADINDSLYGHIELILFRRLSKTSQPLPLPPTHSRWCRGRFYFHLITLRHTTQSVGLLWTRDRPVAETSTWQRQHSQETTSKPPVGFESTIPASARPHTYALDRAATGIVSKT